MKRQLHLLVIDPQNDFCDLPAEWLPAGTAPALAVPGAHADMLRVAQLIREGGNGLTQISVTLDAHHRYDIAHPAFWRTGDGGAVPPFTQITAQQVRDRLFLPAASDALPRALAYLDALQKAGRYQLMVWPVHCEIGSWGQNIHAAVRAAYNGWEVDHLQVVAKLSKGSNPWTEHYSAVMAEVPDAQDAATLLNLDFLSTLLPAQQIYICGEAGSHCVKASTEHIADYLEAQQGKTALSRLVLLTDCMSPVTGFEAQQRDFLAAMHERGVRLATSADVLPELLANAAA
ncbi:MULTISPECIES: cysteine hydrolase [unclassified Janthinobacterium]|uniref:cysteine hydrolase n=1 Tax=unclassified Janthinobacterium TaxID=2610881 RepID=UPI001E549E64|nr:MULTISPECIES: cysteine hydrolase [unclassified Janthinobacterium]MCC7641488.1 cysteine hydrolase [Janthinobacterium sp. EB271-G4-3-1]MCC7690742.1 cysteine hydrolase [Janthinobacterium sp. EB271-G4-3-2]